MSRLSWFAMCLAVLTIAAGLSGCSEAPESDDAPAAEEAAAAPADEHDHGEAGHVHGEAGHEHDEAAHEHSEAEAGHSHASPEIEEAFAALSPEDHAAAEKQATCPVSGAALGSMGTPLKVTVKDREVFLCCQGCEQAITDDPDTYLAKLDP